MDALHNMIMSGKLFFFFLKKIIFTTRYSKELAKQADEMTCIRTQSRKEQGKSKRHGNPHATGKVDMYAIVS